jgi:hypothetical protein
MQLSNVYLTQSSSFSLEIPVCYGTLNFISVFTSNHYLWLSCVKLMQFTHSHPISLWFIPVLPSHLWLVFQSKLSISHLYHTFDSQNITVLLQATSTLPMLSWSGSSILSWWIHTRLPVLQFSPCFSCSAPVHRLIDCSSLHWPTYYITKAVHHHFENIFLIMHF